MAVHVLRIKPGGETRAIYSDQIKPLMNTGDARVARASHVEPGDPTKGQDPKKWYADMSPVGGPVLDGQDTREEALKLEVSWLLKHGTPTPTPSINMS